MRRKSNGNRHLKNYVAIVLDESGSMQAMRREAVDAFNKQVHVLQKQAADMETLICLVKFNTTVPEPVYWNRPVRKAAPVALKDYRPDGLTAMLDAVGETINRLSEVSDAADENVSFLVVVISDGAENNSKVFTWKDIAEKIQAVTATGRWTFAYMGANQDLGQVSRELSIPICNTAAFAASPSGMVEASNLHAAAAMAFIEERRAGLTATRRFYARDGSEQVDAGSAGPAGD